MKVNLPVTDTEVPFGDDESIVSRTDLRGVITYINDTFLRVSGFTEAELIGSSHNIVRHPDMPPEAFADLWRTLKSGKHRRSCPGPRWRRCSGSRPPRTVQ